MIAAAMETVLMNTTRRYAPVTIFLEVSSFPLSMFVFLEILLHFFALKVVTVVADPSSSVSNVESYNLFQGVGTQKSTIMQQPKERSHRKHHPSNHKQNPHHLTRQQYRIRISSSPTVKPSHVVRRSIHRLHKCRLGKQTHRQRAPDPIDHVHGNGIHGIVDPPSYEELGAAQVKRPRDKSDDDAGPAFYDGASCCYCYQSA
mmetsp:Transcript_9295/g.14991  ORF Transcript_9295/g.14991 Transcript_9295/m.14991 type:complete len:202 (+) Transcript_9295:445-1050(+)